MLIGTVCRSTNPANRAPSRPLGVPIATARGANHLSGVVRLVAVGRHSRHGIRKATGQVQDLQLSQTAGLTTRREQL
jgi:hypothetical protein